MKILLGIVCLLLPPAVSQAQPVQKLVPVTVSMPVSAPAARAHHAGAYDAERHQLIVHGGYIYANGVKAVGDTWAWDGKSWHAIAPVTDPVIVPSLAYDSKRHRLMRFAGNTPDRVNTGQTSVLDGDAWQTVQEDATMARGGAGMIYDARRDRLVMFGGRYGQTQMADTWEFDGTQWTPTWMPGPSLRDPTGMVYDSDRGVTVLYGGFRPLAALDDTWEWNGKTWTQVAVTGPGPRAWPGMAYDSARHRVVLFAGEDNKGTFFGDTWAYDGKAWTRIATKGPPPRIQFVMDYDTARDRIVLFGGMDANGHYLDDVWEFDGRDWQKRWPG